MVKPQLSYNLRSYQTNPPIHHTSGWWFQPLWKILVSWDYYSQYMENKTCSNSPPRHVPVLVYGDGWVFFGARPPSNETIFQGAKCHHQTVLKKTQHIEAHTKKAQPPTRMDENQSTKTIGDGKTLQNKIWCVRNHTQQKSTRSLNQPLVLPFIYLIKSPVFLVKARKKYKNTQENFTDIFPRWCKYSKSTWLCIYPLVIFHGYVSHNQMVIGKSTIIDGKITIFNGKKSPCLNNQRLIRLPC